MRIIFFLMLLFLWVNSAHSQSVNINTFKAQYEEAKKSNNNADFILTFYKDNTATEKFKSKTDFFKALHFLVEEASKNRDTIYFELLVAIGARLQDAGEYEEAYYYIYTANEQKKLVRASNVDVRKTFYIQSAFSRYYFRRFDESRAFLIEAYKFNNLTVYDSIQINNTLGLICRDKKELECSKYYFLETLKIAKHNQNKAWIGISSGNLGNYYFSIKEYKKAREFSMVDYENSLREKDFYSAISVLSIIVKIDVAMKDLEMAKQGITELERLIKLENSTTTRLEMLLAKEAYLEALGDYKSLHFTHKALVATQDTLSARRDRENNLRTEFQVRFEAEQGKVKLLAERKIRSDQNFLSLIIIIIVCLISLIPIIYQISRRRKAEKEILRKEKEELNKDLKRAENEMLGILKRLIEKNEIIELLENDLNTLQNSNQFKEEEKIVLKSKLQSFILLTDDDWIAFKMLFEKLNPDFYEKITLHLPDLTNAEIRLVSLLKLNLSVNEMSRALAISVESVRRSSLRLRKKLDLGDHEHLVKFIFSI